MGVALPERGWLHSDTVQIPAPSSQAQFDVHLSPLASSTAYKDKTSTNTITLDCTIMDILAKYTMYVHFFVLQTCFSPEAQQDIGRRFLCGHSAMELTILTQSVELHWPKTGPISFCSWTWFFSYRSSK